ncbi:MAG: FliO/MopB family protein [Hyphomonadaceae bacterium]
MHWLDWLKAFFALIFVLGLIAATALAARRMGMLQAPAPGGKRRMSVVESLFLDPRRRLLIVRVDAEEHVLLLSATHDVVVASRPASSAPADAPT